MDQREAKLFELESTRVARDGVEYWTRSLRSVL